jgi:hypothetical protein
MLCLLWLASVGMAALSSPRREDAVASVLSDVDANKDTLISESEVEQYLRDEAPLVSSLPAPHLWSTSRKHASIQSLASHLVSEWPGPKYLLTSDGVAEWLHHGLQLGNVSEAFRARGVTGLDFFAFCARNSSDARFSSLGVRSELQRRRIRNVMKLILFSEPVLPPAPVVHVQSGGACGEPLSLRWSLSEDVRPPVHLFVVRARYVQRLSDGRVVPAAGPRGEAGWFELASVSATADSPGVRRFRWSAAEEVRQAPAPLPGAAL